MKKKENNVMNIKVDNMAHKLNNFYKIEMT
jgi:hypothetical protein